MTNWVFRRNILLGAIIRRERERERERVVAAAAEGKAQERRNTMCNA